MHPAHVQGPRMLLLELFPFLGEKKKKVIWSVLLFLFAWEFQLNTDQSFCSSPWLTSMHNPSLHPIFYIFHPLLTLGSLGWYFVMQFLIWDFHFLFNRDTYGSSNPVLAFFFAFTFLLRVVTVFSWWNSVCFRGVVTLCVKATINRLKYGFGTIRGIWYISKMMWIALWACQSIEDICYWHSL